MLLGMLVLGAQVALPHSHVGNPHDAEFCAGHLADHGAPDLQHAGACSDCRAQNRTRGPAQRAAALFAKAPIAVVCIWRSAPQHHAGAEAHACDAPRAPPPSAVSS